MKLLNITIPASSSVNQDVPPSTFFYLDKLSSGGSLDVQLYGEAGALLATLDNLETGTSYKSADLGQPFVTMRLKNNSPAANTLAAYVGLDEVKTSKTNLSGSVATDSAAAVELYSDSVDLTTTATNLISLLPAGAVVSDWSVRVAKGTVIISATATGDGMEFGSGKGMAGSNSYPLFMRAKSGAATVQILASFKR